MAKKSLPTPELLSKLLSYNPESGDLKFREEGKPALHTLYQDGYKRGKLLGHNIYAHRAAYAIYHGAWPDNIDHINGDRSDNRITNLRSVSKAENNRNRAIFKNSSSGVCGVGWHKATGKWRARIEAEGKQKYLGIFRTFNEAVSARLAAEKKYGYHKNHGRLPA